MATVRSPELERGFCLSLMDNGGHIGKACKSVNVSRECIYNWRQDEEFAAKFDAAMRLGVEGLEDEAKRRGFEGTAEPVFYKGAQVSTIQKYSDLLLIFTLKAQMPEKYRERFEHTGANGQPLIPDEITTLEVARRIAHLLELTAESQRDAIDVTPKLIEQEAGHE